MNRPLRRYPFGRWHVPVTNVVLVIVLCAALLITGAAAAATLDAVIDVNEPLNLPVSTTATITSSHLHASSVNPPNLVVYTLDVNVSSGSLKLNNVALNTGDTFTQEDIDNDRLTYSAPVATGTDGFTTSLTDNAAPNGSVDFKIHINKAEPTAYPSSFTATANSISRITLTWAGAASGPAPDGYVVLCSPDSYPPAPTDTSYPLNNPCVDVSGSNHVGAGVRTATWNGLSSETTYYFAIYPYARTTYSDGSGVYYDYFAGVDPPQASAQTFKTYSISGTVLDGSSFPMMGLLVDAGSGHTAYTGEDGTYTLTGLVPGDYAVSLQIPCYSFTPDHFDVTVSNAENHVRGVDFTGTRWPCIRGSVYFGAMPLEGVTITNGGALNTVTQPDGSYFLPVTIDHWSGALWPQKTNYYFTPERRTYVDITADEYLQGYTARRIRLLPYQVIAAWNAVPGALGYYLDVATDPAFTNFVPGYQDLVIGRVTQYTVTRLTPGVSYYYRVRPFDGMSSGSYSVPVEVVTEWGGFFPLINRK